VESRDREVQDRLTRIFELMLQDRTEPRIVRALRDRDLLISRPPPLHVFAVVAAGYLFFTDGFHWAVGK
jgi:hypothetical protein